MDTWVRDGWIARATSWPIRRSSRPAIRALAARKVDLFQCIHNHGWLAFTTYQPADRFWPFQAIEAGVVVALAVGLLALAIWWVRRRIA